MLSPSTDAPSTSFPSRYTALSTQSSFFFFFLHWLVDGLIDGMMDWLVFVMLWMELRALHRIGKHSTTRIKGCVFQRAFFFLDLWNLNWHLDSLIWTGYLPSHSPVSCCPKALNSKSMGILASSWPQPWYGAPLFLGEPPAVQKSSPMGSVHDTYRK